MNAQQTLLSTGESFGLPDTFQPIGFRPATDVVPDRCHHHPEGGNQPYATFNARRETSVVPGSGPHSTYRTEESFGSEGSPRHGHAAAAVNFADRVFSLEDGRAPQLVNQPVVAWPSSHTLSGSVTPPVHLSREVFDPAGSDRKLGFGTRVVIYARLSTSQQEREGTSMDTQVDECLVLVAQDGLSVDPANILREEWISVDFDRPLFNRLRSMILNRSVDVIYVHSPDRLVRDPLHLMIVMHECSVSGVDLRFVHAEFPDTPEGRLMAYITGYVAQRERLHIIERTYRGKRRTAREHQRLPNGTGYGLFGYDYHKDNKTRTINEEEAAVVRRIFQWAVEGWTCYRIALKLNEANIPTKRGCSWHPLAVKRTLSNEAYTGVQFFGRKRYQKVSQHKREVTDRPESEWIRIEGFTPELISRSVFDTVGRRLAAPQAHYVNGERKYLLTGFVVCPTCGTGVTGTTLGGKYRYYRCRGTAKTSKRGAICHEGYIPADLLEEIVWNALVDTIRDPSVLVAELQDHLTHGDGELGARMKELKHEISDLKSQQSGLLRLWRNPNVDQSLLEQQLGPLKVQCDEKEEALRLLEDQQRQNDDAADVATRLEEYCRLISEQLDYLDFDGQRATLAAFGLQAVASRQVLRPLIRVDPNVSSIAHTLASMKNWRYKASFRLL